MKTAKTPKKRLFTYGEYVNRPDQVYDDSMAITVGIFPDLIIRTEKVFPFQPKIVKESPRKYLAELAAAEKSGKAPSTRRK